MYGTFYKGLLFGFILIKTFIFSIFVLPSKLDIECDYDGKIVCVPTKDWYYDEVFEGFKVDFDYFRKEFTFALLWFLTLG